MRSFRGWTRVGALLLAAWSVAAAPRAGADGFAAGDQSAKGMGLAGAFVAQADDGSAMFYNPGGLALIPKAATQAGAVGQGLLGETLFQGLAPGLAAGGTGKLDDALQLPSVHAFLVKPLRKRLTVGLGVDTPFQLSNQWADPDTFPGRSLAIDSEIRTLDTTAAAAVRLGKAFGLGVGVVLRSSDVSLSQRLLRADPLSGDIVDVAEYALASDTETAIGFRAGVQQQVSHYFAWGIAYRSAIEVDYAGSGLLTQIPTGNDQFDDLLADSLPFNQELAMTTRLDYPATATLGVAFALGKSMRLEVDAGMTGWSDVDALVFNLPNNPSLDRTFQLDLADTSNASVGWLLERPSGTQIRAGVAFQEGAQPPSTVGPVLFDSDSTTLAVGFGKDWLDLAVSWTTYDELTIANNVDAFNGRYSRDVFRVGITVGKKGKLKVPEAPKAPKVPKLPGG